MVNEDNLPDSFKRVAFHPESGFYAWKKVTLDKLFDEFTKSNLAVVRVEAIVVEEKIVHTIPLRTGEIELFELKNVLVIGEDWYDFVDRINKETLETINGWELEKQTRPDIRNKIWYHFKLENNTEAEA